MTKDLSVPARRDGLLFEFLVHPRVDVAADLARVFPPLGLIPSRAYERAFDRFEVPPFDVATIALASRPSEVLGKVVLVPATPRQLLGDPRKARARITRAVDRAAERGTPVVGLGALTAPASGGGGIFRKRSDIGVTNGNALTAAVTAESVLRVAERAPRSGVALVGATGSVGSAVARLLARAGVPDLLLVGRTQTTLDALAADLPVSASTSTSMEDVQDVGLVVLLTSATDALLRSEHLSHGTIVIDDTQPRNTSPELLVTRPDLVVLDGGIVKTPGLLRRRGDLDLPMDQSFACLTETALLGLAGHRGHGTLGRPALTEADRMIAISDAMPELGLALAPPSSFGARIEDAVWSDSDPLFMSLLPSLPRRQDRPDLEDRVL